MQEQAAMLGGSDAWRFLEPPCVDSYQLLLLGGVVLLTGVRVLLGTALTLRAFARRAGAYRLDFIEAVDGDDVIRLVQLGILLVLMQCWSGLEFLTVDVDGQGRFA